MLFFREFFDIKKIMNAERKKSLGFSRRSMPQIYSGDMQEFLKFLSTNNIRHSNSKTLPNTLKASQKEFNDKKVMHMVQNAQKYIKNSSKPILVSSDNYVIDGHHRWLATKIYNEINDTNIEMQIVKIQHKAKPLIAMMKTFDSVNFKKVSEEISCVTTKEQQT